MTHVEENLFALDISSPETLDDAIFESIMMTQGKFNVISITVNLSSCQQLRRLKNIFKKYGENIKKLRWEKVALTLNEYGTFLNMLPNLKELAIRKLSIKDVMDEANDYSPFKIPMLETLVIQDCDFNVEFLLFRIPVNVLRKVIIVQDRIRNVSKFFERQHNVKKVKVHKKVQFDCQKLTHLSFEPWLESDVINMIRAQTELVYMDVIHSCRLIENSHLMTAIFDEVCALKHLQVLKIDIEYVASKSIGRIKQLNNLKELQLSCDGFTTDATREEEMLEKLKALCSNTFYSLVSLTLLFPNTVISDDSIRLLGNKFTMIKKLTLRAKFYNLDVVLTSFKMLSCLDATFTTNDPSQSSYYVSPEFATLRYPNLKNFNLDIIDGRSNYFKSSNVFTKLLNDLSNLESLHISANFLFNKSLLHSIFTCLPRLTSLYFTQQLAYDKTRIDLNDEVMALLYRKKLSEVMIADRCRYLSVDEDKWYSIFSNQFETINFSEDQRRVHMQRLASKDIEIYKDPFA